MTVLAERFTRACREEIAAVDVDVLPSAVARACVRVLPVDAAGISLMSGSTTRVPLGASDDDAAQAERLQFTHGDGPCFTAMASGRAVLVTEESWRESWPVLAVEHFRRTPFRGGLSLPLRVGEERIGVLDLYLRTSRAISGDEIVDAQTVAAGVTATLLDPSLHPDGEWGEEGTDPEVGAASWLSGPAARGRRQVWIAVGMANLVLGLPSGEALAVLRARSFSEGLTLDRFSDDVVSGRFDVSALRESPVP